jgi:sulfoxide reductase heme-binding subunit YedZ
VSLGLLMSTRLLKGRAGDLRTLHEALSLSSLVALAVHGLALIGDHYLHPSLVDIALPFAGSYRTFWTSLGIIGGWAMVVLGLSFYGRRWIGTARWRKLHRFTAAAWLLGLIHALGEGTDAGRLWFMAMVGAVVVPALVLLATRLRGPRSGAEDGVSSRGGGEPPSRRTRRRPATIAFR